MKMIRGAFVPIVLAVVFGVAGVAKAQQCDVFTDVLASDSYCPAVQWLKNRQVTTGCATGMYCPNDYPTRAQTALFMNRLGKALSPEILYEFDQPGPITLPVAAYPGVSVCATTDSTSTVGTVAMPLNHPTTAVINATFSGLANDALAYRSIAWYSTDAGASWNPVPTTNEHWVSAAAGAWSESTSVAVMDLPPGLAYRFSIGIRRGDLGLGNGFTYSFCQIAVTIHNQNGAGPPY